MASSPERCGSSNKVTYPSEWSDKDRMSYLLAPFPPSDKPLPLEDPKLSFWSSFIMSSSRELRKFIVSARDLQERFKWNGQTSPGCLSVVLESMERTGEVTKLLDFYSVQQQSWLSWGAGMVKKPVTWALGSYLPAQEYEGEYVINSIAKECAEAVLSQHQDTVLYKSTDNVMKGKDFEKLCLGVVSNEAVPVLTQQLALNGQLVTARTEFGYEAIKLSPIKAKGLKVADIDIGIVRIKETIVKLSEQIGALEGTINRLKQSAKDKVKEDKKGALRILHHCRLKKALLNSKESMLDNVQNALHRIQVAETDAMVYAAYKSSVDALKFLRNSQGLTLEAVEDVHDEMQDLLEEGEQIAAVLVEGPAGEDEDDLLRELEGMMDQEPPGLDQLELHMAKLSVEDKEGEDEGRHLLEQLPPVPAGVKAPLPNQKANRTKHEKLLVAA